MLLVIDVGNTNIVMGIYEGATLLKDLRIRTDKNMTADEFHVFAAHIFSDIGELSKSIKKIVISSVVPPLFNMLDLFCRKYTGKNPHWISARSVPDMPVLYTNPDMVGSDRIVNAYAAYHKYRASLIVIDFGTATTFDCVSEKGEYLGGAISPGINTAAEGLYIKAPRLPRVELFNPPEKAIGIDTIGSLKSGIILGYAGLVDGMVWRMAKEMNANPKIIATGGLSLIMHKVSETISSIEPDLTLEGLRIIGDLL